MRRKLLIVLLLAGTVGGFGMGFASKKGHHRAGGWCHGQADGARTDGAPTEGAQTDTVEPSAPDATIE